jgi:tyrosine-protein kinase Etk/Wzc
MYKWFDQARDPAEERQLSASLRLAPATAAPVRKELTRLLQALFLSSARHRSVTFSGVEPGVGCSFVCAHTAELLSECRLGSVCLVDANLRSPVLHSHFGVSRRPGLADLIAEPGPALFAQNVKDGELWLVSAGITSADPRILLNSDKARARVLELCSLFDFVLIDTDSSNPQSGATSLGEVTDGCALVIDFSSTAHQKALKARNSWRAAGVNILGVVLNRRPFPPFRSISSHNLMSWAVHSQRVHGTRS